MFLICCVGHTSQHACIWEEVHNICDLRGLRNFFGIEVILPCIVAFYWNLFNFLVPEEKCSKALRQHSQRLHSLLQLLLSYYLTDQFSYCLQNILIYLNLFFKLLKKSQFSPQWRKLITQKSAMRSIILLSLPVFFISLIGLCSYCLVKD